MENNAVAIFVVAAEDRRGGLAAQVAINAIRVHIPGTRNVFREPIFVFSHKCPFVCSEAVRRHWTLDAIG